MGDKEEQYDSESDGGLGPTPQPPHEGALPPPSPLHDNRNPLPHGHHPSPGRPHDRASPAN
ncbi:hypothetical protein GCM10010449_49400 [Streptomyces rectiviolaceus]|uniref:Uncharacterized protein n=1 Tax=Streptomyces rectiviolaceus TaxID=332591 RepID=A0ABP6MRT0_9ACTN